MIDIAFPSDSNIKNEYEKQEKYQGPSGNTSTRRPLSWNNFRTLCPEEQLRYCAEPSNSKAPGRGPEVEEDTHTTHRGEKGIFMCTYIYIYAVYINRYSLCILTY